MGIFDKKLNLDGLYYLFNFDPTYKIFRIVNYSGYCPGSSEDGLFRTTVEYWSDKDSVDFYKYKLKEYNPDSNNTIWIYKMDGKKYIPLLVSIDNTIKSIGFNKDLLSDKIDLTILKSRLGYSSRISFYHPNEVFACDVTEQLILGNLDSEYRQFLSNLS